MHSEKALKYPVYSTEELKPMRIEEGLGPRVMVTDNSLDKLLFLAERFCQALGRYPGENRALLEKLTDPWGYVDLRPDGIMGVGLSRRQTNKTARTDPVELRQYEYTLYLDNRNAPEDPDQLTRFETAVEKALDPDNYPMQLL